MLEQIPSINHQKNYETKLWNIICYKKAMEYNHTIGMVNLLLSINLLNIFLNQAHRSTV
jgi:hypothetical protein